MQITTPQIESLIERLRANSGAHIHTDSTVRVHAVSNGKIALFINSKVLDLKDFSNISDNIKAVKTDLSSMINYFTTSIPPSDRNLFMDFAQLSNITASLKDHQSKLSSSTHTTFEYDSASGTITLLTLGNLLEENLMDHIPVYAKVQEKFKVTITEPIQDLINVFSIMQEMSDIVLEVEFYHSFIRLSNSKLKIILMLSK